MERGISVHCITESKLSSQPKSKTAAHCLPSNAIGFQSTTLTVIKHDSDKFMFKSINDKKIFCFKWIIKMELNYQTFTSWADQHIY
jgi:hypothetical protein